MKNNPPALLLTVFLIFAITTNGYSQEQKREYYQLKTYALQTEKQDSVMDIYLEDAYLPALKRAGIENVGVFKYRPNNFLTANKIFVLIPFISFEQFENLDEMLAQDKAYISIGSDYVNAKYDEPPYERINSVLMRAFIGMPQMKPSEVEGARKDRVYELRSYESPTEATYQNKVMMFNKGGEIELFESLGANAVFYAEVLSGDRMPNLMYMTTYQNMEKRDAVWKTFFASEKWGELSTDLKYLNNMNKADKLLLYPTEYSDY